MTIFTRTFAAAVAVVSLPAMASAYCPSYANSGAGLSYSSDDAWTPRSHSVIAGGNLNLSNCGSVPGVGYIVESPDFTLQYDAQGQGRALELRVNASCDAVILVNTASAQWQFNDDYQGTDPGIRIPNAPSGQYDIWVGTYNESTCSAELIVETF